MSQDNPKFNGPTKTWLDLCILALRDFEKELGKYDSQDVAVTEYINRKLTK